VSHAWATTLARVETLAFAAALLAASEGRAAPTVACFCLYQHILLRSV